MYADGAGGPVPEGLPRLGLCCIFREEPIRFRVATAAVLMRLPRSEQLARLNELCLHNAASLQAALEYCAAHGIGCFRVLSQIMPLRTHPVVGYDPDDLPDGDAVVAAFRRCGETAARHGIRTTFHPDQFVVLNSPREEVVTSSLREIEYQAEVAEWVGADVINIHGGGAFGEPAEALERLRRGLDRLSEGARRRITLENDDRVYRPSDLLPVCRDAGVPLVYDVHHHRVLPDGLTVEAATELAMATWNREPLFHLSSPLNGWDGPQPARHHDFVDPADFPACWLRPDITVEIEAKAKELAIGRLRAALAERTER